MFQNDAFRALERQECLRLLGKVPVGRVVYTRQALPAVLPINFSLDTDASVLLRTSSDSDLVRAIDGVVVAFEVDEFDAATRSGWSVVVTGRAGVVTDPAERERLAHVYKRQSASGSRRPAPRPGCPCGTQCSYASRRRWSPAVSSAGLDRMRSPTTADRGGSPELLTSGISARRPRSPARRRRSRAPSASGPPAGCVPTTTHGSRRGRRRCHSRRGRRRGAPRVRA